MLLYSVRFSERELQDERDKTKAEDLEPISIEEGVGEVKEEPVGDEMESEIRSYESECEDGVHIEQLSTVPESVFEFEW